jgi:hypothetical protein
METWHENDRTAAGRNTRLPAKVVLVGLLLIVGLSLFVHLRGLTHDLPAPGADEPYFVLPAARMAWQSDPDPQWFGHPGSTVIYPLAVAYRAREVVFHGAPLFGRAPSLAARFRSDPSSFYEIGRVWVMLLSVATVPLLFLLGRRVFGDLTGLLAAGAWALVPLAVSYGTIVRTDAAGACFGLASLLLCMLALDDPRPRRFAFAGLAIGFAIASRYFMVTLVPVLVAAWIVAKCRDRARVRWTSLAAGLGVALVGFALTTPFFFLDWHAVGRSLQAETVGTVTNDRFGWFDNLGYYLTNAIPDAISWVAPVLAVVGLGIAVTRRDARRLLLAGFVVVFLGVISLSTLHWQRWSIQVLPVILLFAASAVVTAAAAIGRQVRARPARRWVPAALVVAGAIALAAEPAGSLVDYERTLSAPSTRQLMRSWVVEHVPRGTQIAMEVKGPELRTAGYVVLDRYDLPTDGTLGDYAAHGYHYLVVNAFVSLRYRVDEERYPVHAQFYRFLRERGTLLADFGSQNGAHGPHLKLYYMDPAVVAGPHKPKNVAICARSTHDKLTAPKPLYPVGEEILGEPRTQPTATQVVQR